MAATIKDIRKLTGLSLSTISKYLNGGNVREENKKAIEEAIEKLDFRVNEFARSLKTNRSKTIGVLIPELNSTFHTTIIADVENILRKHGYGIIICDSWLNKDIEKQALEFLLSKMVDGIITIPYDKSGEHLKAADKCDVPVVLIDRLTTDYKTDAVIVDNSGASEKTVSEFIAKGHSRIGIICGPDGIYTMQERMLGFRKILEKNNIPIDENLIAIEDLTISGGYNGIKRLLSQNPAPTAIYCTNYEITLGAIIAINEIGVKIPQDLSLIGFDNLELSQIVKPKLTIIMQPMRKIAEAAAKLMIDRLENKDVKESRIIQLDTTLELGESVAPVG